MRSPWRMISLLTTGLLIVFIISCKHDAGTAPTSVKKWDAIPLKAVFEVPAPAGRLEEGDADLELFSDNSLKWDFHIHNLSPSDALTAAHIHVGDPATSGPVFINLNPTFNGPGANGTVTGLRAGQVDSLLHLPVYINVHSNQAPGGLVRSQMDRSVSYAVDVDLLGDNEVPAVTTTASGHASLRLSGDTLFSLVTYKNIEANDTFTVSHVHRGAAGVNGPVRIFLASSLADFNVPRKTFLLDSLKTILTSSDPVYVNAHTKLKAGGKIRGQIR